MTFDGVKIEYKYLSDGPDMVPKQHSIRDGSRLISFKGVRLASISSEREDRPRWTLIDLYRTDGNMFIAHRVGISSIVHDISCMAIAGKRLPGIEHIKDDETPISERTPCAACKPDIQTALTTDPLSLRVEINRHWTTIDENARDLINALYTTRNNVRTLSYLATTMLIAAAEYDPSISAAIEELKLSM